MNIVRRFINVALHDLTVAVCDAEHKLVSLFHVAPGATMIVEHAEEHVVHHDQGLLPAEGDKDHDAAALAQAIDYVNGVDKPLRAARAAAAAVDTREGSVGAGGLLGAPVGTGLGEAGGPATGSFAAAPAAAGALAGGFLAGSGEAHGTGIGGEAPTGAIVGGLDVVGDAH